MDTPETTGPDTVGETARDRSLDYDYSNFYMGAGDDAFVMLDPFDSWWEEAYPAGYYLFGLPMHTPAGNVVDVRETKHQEQLHGLINLASYNYLGLAGRPEVVEASVQGLRKYGLGACGSPILSGFMDLHERFAAELAEFKNKEACLIFPSGYSGNLGIIAGLMRSGDTVITDQFAHASIIDGIILSKAKVRYFRHNDVADLERKLKKSGNGKTLVVVEGVYSMDGDIAPLPEIVEVCQRYGARTMIDEAHSAFVYGENGRGVAEHFGLDDEIDVHFGTLSKSLGGMGGYVVGSQKLINYLRGFARSRVFSCALAPPVVAGLLKSLEIARNEPELRTALWNNVEFMKAKLTDLQVDTGVSTSQVIPVMIRDDERIFAIGEDLIHEGVYLNPVRFPAVGKHKSRFRISVTASHTKEELKQGAEIIARVLRRYGLCP